MAYAIATDAVEARHVLVVTFTDKAATEMRERITGLGQAQVATGTFHATAFKQLRFFWPLLSERPLPEVLPSKLALIAPLQQRLPGGYRFFPARDLAQEVEWAKARRLTPATYLTGAAAAGHEGPLPPELMAGLFRQYETAKQRAGRIDFEDMLGMTVGLLEEHPDALAQIRSRHRWLSVDEYQDTNALQQSLLDLWLGERDDLAVVGDVDQTIYSFTGASSEFLTGFPTRFPHARVVHLERNYRSTPQVLELANRLLATAPVLLGRPKRLVATLPTGLLPTIRAFQDAAAEAAAVIREAKHLRDSGVPPGEMAILVRTNAQLPEYETGLRAAGLPFQIGGERFFERPEVRGATRAIQSAARRRPGGGDPGPDGGTGVSQGLVATVLGIWQRELGFDPDDEPEAEGLRQRHAALVTLLGFAERLEDEDPAATLAEFLGDLEARATVENEGAGGAGIALLTFHRAKGLEWDAVFLPALEEGLLPIRQSAEAAEVEEERRLLYVGITRARQHLWLSWARRRVGNQGREVGRRASRFLAGLERRDRGPQALRAVAEERAPGAGAPRDASARHAPLTRSAESEGLRAWRTERARADGMPSYVILHDSTLEAIVEARPRTIAELSRIKGMGPTKLERYGVEILAALEGDFRTSRSQ